MTYGPAIDIKCAKCGNPLRLIALIKTREVIERILVAMHLTCPPTCPSCTRRARPRSPSGRRGARRTSSTDRGAAGQGVLG